MNSYFIYILKVCIGLSLFIIPYYFFLRNDPALKLKRFFLLGGIFAAFIFPFLTLKSPSLVNQYTIGTDDGLFMQGTGMTLASQDIPPETGIGISANWPTILLSLYLCGALLLLFRNVFLLLKWNRVWKRYGNKSTEVVYSGNEQIFSMFTRIFLPVSLCNTTAIDSILLHEKAHVRQLHFIDLLIMETTILLTWFNPFTWLFMFMVKENHEHLADRFVIGLGVDKADYGARLLNQTIGFEVFSLAHPFNHSSITKRFEMMKKSNSIRSGMVKIAILLPLILFPLGFAVGKARQGDKITGKVVFSDTGNPAAGTNIIIKGTSTGTIADLDGNYKLELNEQAEVVFSFVGYKTQYYRFNPGEYRFVALEREVIEIISSPGSENDKKYMDKDEILPVPEVNKALPANNIFRSNKPELLDSIPKDKKTSGKPLLIQEEVEVFFIVEEMPMFNNGNPAVEFRNFIYKNLRYPEEEKQKKISGRVIAQFTVSSEGNVTDVKIVKSASEGLDRETVRVIESSPAWTPGKQRGKAVPVVFTFPVEFLIQEKNSTSDTIKNVVHTEEEFYGADTMAEYKDGGIDGISRFIAQNIRYPISAANNAVSAKIFVQFDVSEKGKVTNTQIARTDIPGNMGKEVVVVAHKPDINPEIDPKSISDLEEEALRVVKLLSDFTPAQKDGKNVKVQVTIPINFILQ